MRVFKTKTSKQNLCDYCMYDQPECPSASHIEFGDGVGNDNVIECSEYVGKTECMDGETPVNIEPTKGVK